MATSIFSGNRESNQTVALPTIDVDDAGVCVANLHGIVGGLSLTGFELRMWEAKKSPAVSAIVLSIDSDATFINPMNLLDIVVSGPTKLTIAMVHRALGGAFFAALGCHAIWATAGAEIGLLGASSLGATAPPIDVMAALDDEIVFRCTRLRPSVDEATWRWLIHNTVQSSERCEARGLIDYPVASEKRLVAVLGGQGT